MPSLLSETLGELAVSGIDRSRRPVLVATDGEHDSDAAFAMARLLAEPTGSDVQVLACMTPFGAIGELQTLKPEPDERWRARRDHVLHTVRGQIKRALPAGCSWPVTIVAGYGGEDIAAFARQLHPRLIVMGRGRHGFLERVSRGPEEVLRVLQLTDVPVLAVEAGAHALPQRIVVATDFSEYSSHAGHVALDVAAEDATIFLAHVRPRTRIPHVTVPPAALAYEGALPAQFAEARAALAARTTQVVRTVELGGEPGIALRNFAVACQADLIVSATHGRGMIDRMILGSVAVQLLRHARCSLLCVPASAFDHRLDIPAGAAPLRDTIRTADLAGDLARFTARNSGRACRVELSRPDDVGQVLVRDRPFLESSFDAQRNALSLDVGTRVGPTAEHTHILSSIRGVDRLIDPAGGDRGLMIDDGDAGVVQLVFTA